MKDTRTKACVELSRLGKPHDISGLAAALVLEPHNPALVEADLMSRQLGHWTDEYWEIDRKALDSTLLKVTLGDLVAAYRVYEYWEIDHKALDNTLLGVTLRDLMVTYRACDFRNPVLQRLIDVPAYVRLYDELTNQERSRREV